MPPQIGSGIFPRFHNPYGVFQCQRDRFQKPSSCFKSLRQDLLSKDFYDTSGVESKKSLNSSAGNGGIPNHLPETIRSTTFTFDAS